MDIGEQQVVFAELEAGGVSAIGFNTAAYTVQPGIEPGGMGGNCVDVDAVHLLCSHLRSQYCQNCSSATHIHHHPATDILLILKHRGEHHPGSVVMPGPECHLRTQPDVVPGRPAGPVIGLLHSHRPIHHNRLKSALPLRIPVAERYRDGHNRRSERQFREHKP